MSTDQTNTVNRDALVADWERYFGCPPPKGVRNKTLELAVCWHRQAIRSGGLSRESQQYLLKLARDGKADTPAATHLKPGARLVREWRGEPHVVDVLESGFLYREHVYASLSEIARLITGARWSGPRFFGLKKANRKRDAA